MIDKEFLKLLLSSTDNISSSLVSNFKAEYLDIDVKDFSPIRELYASVIIFFSKFRAIVPADQLESFLISRTYAADKIKQILLLHDEISIIETDKNFDFLVQEIKHRSAIKLLHSRLSSGADSLLRNDLPAALTNIKTGINKVEYILQNQVEEGAINDSVVSRANIYKSIRDKLVKPGLATGFKSFDALSGGLKPGELDVVMSGTGQGKSTFLLNVGYNVQMLLNKNVLLFSLELPKRQIELRYDSLSSGLNLNKLKYGMLTKEEEETYKQHLIKLRDNSARFYIVDLPICTASIVAAKLTEISALFPIDLVIVDYLGLMKPVISGGSGWESISNSALELRDVARTYKVPILTAMQVNKGSMENKGSATYGVTDVALSFQVMFHADTVLTLKTANSEVLNMGVSICELNAKITKCRDGQIGDFVIDASFACMKMLERDHGYTAGS